MNKIIVDILKFVTENQYNIITGVFGICLLIQLYYYLGIYSRLLFYSKKKAEHEKEPLSVIICAKNEELNLDKFLPSVLTQDYPDYEVIVVNDCSTDNTDLIIGKYIKQYPHLRTTTITEDKKFTHGKKLALTIGIKAAKNEILVFTDADCEPVSDKWLSKIQRNFRNQISIVIGYGGYFSKFSLLNNYIRYDTLIIALQYLSYKLAGFPYMGVGRNLAYRKSLFFKNKGFASHYQLLSGDDDLFVNENANKSNTEIEISKESHTRSVPARSFRQWFKRKKRHFVTGKYYKRTHKFLLATEQISRLFYYITFAFLISKTFFIEFIIGAFMLRMIIQLIILKNTMIRLNEKHLLLSSLFYDIFSTIINFGLYISTRLRRSTRQWK
ncbi:MAG: glycosyltransferase [Bacteroidales bacterium]|nr:MAG: glycosyltransferase [Bacteroidales bacterium]